LKRAGLAAARELTSDGILRDQRSDELRRIGTERGEEMRLDPVPVTTPDDSVSDIRNEFPANMNGSPHEP
jgi:hypothetical protein